MAQDRGPIPSLLSWRNKKTITEGEYAILAKQSSGVSSGMSFLWHESTSGVPNLI